MGQLNLRRLRQNSFVRELTREIHLAPSQLIQPHFVVEGLSQRQEVSGMTGVFRETPASLAQQVEADLNQGVNKILLFGVPKSKSSTAFQFDFMASQIAELRRLFGNTIWIATDVCLCSYTQHGQCGVLNSKGDHVENEATVLQLVEQSLRFAQAGADCIAPSDMMDGRIGAIRSSLSQKGYERTLIMSYAVKFQSQFYGPFREAADSAPKGKSLLKDRATYQIDPTRPRDALLCAERDALEGADILMVKPALPYLDILKTLSEKVSLPWSAYQVSGEYASIELLASQGLVSKAAAHVEAWTSIRRAGATSIVTYGARYAKEWLK